ncbi:MAG: glycosyltransferase family 1 protein, partial [Brachybacterium tyrofermentans]
LLDAATHGLGVVATDVGGNREIVPEQCLVRAEDLPAVARAIVVQGDEPAVRPSASGRTDIARMCSAVADAYGEVAT